MKAITLHEVADRATALGWTRPAGADHVLYVARAIRALRTLADAGPALAPGVRPLWWAYSQEVRDLDPDGLCGLAPSALEGADSATVLWLALYAPSRIAVEVALLAVDRRRTGRAQKLLRGARRIQLAGERAGHGPVGRAGARGAYVGDDGRTRGLYLLARETDREREVEWDRFWTVCEGGGVADARPSSRQRPSREGEGEGGVDWFQLEAGGF